MDDQKAAAAPLPGPPRGRRHGVDGPLPGRIAGMRAAEQGPGGLMATGASLLRLLRDVTLLVKDLAVDPRVPIRDKAVAAAAVGYAVLPATLVPRGSPVPARLVDVVAFWLAVRRLLVGAGYDVIFELWRGTDQGFATVLTLAGVED